MLGIEHFTGEMGGSLALAFAMGAGAGYGFALRTILKVANGRIDELKAEQAADRAEHKAEMAGLKSRINELEDQRFDLARGK